MNLEEWNLWKPGCWNWNVYEMEIKNFEFFYLPVRQGLFWVPDQNKYIWSCSWVPPGNISQPEPESKEERQERKKSLKDFSDDLLSVMIVEEWSGRWQRGLNSHLQLQKSVNGHNALNKNMCNACFISCFHVYGEVELYCIDSRIKWLRHLPSS